MANINRTPVITLLDAEVYDVITSFDVEHEYWAVSCPTCGSTEYDTCISYATVISDKGENRVDFNTVSYYDIVAEMPEQMRPTQADLMRLLLSKERLQLISCMTLEQFLAWLEDKLGDIADGYEVDQ